MLPLKITQDRETARKGNKSLSLHIVSEFWESFLHMDFIKKVFLFLVASTFA